MTLCTLEWLEARCHRDPDTACLIWRGQTDGNNLPVAWTPMDANGKRKRVMVRRDAWVERFGPIPNGMVVTCACDNPSCVYHLELITQAEVVRRQWARKEVHAVRVAATTEASRRRGKLDLEKARDIRNSNEVLKVVAQRHGISMTLASQVRRGIAWKEPRNPFAGLGAWP